MPIIRDIDHPIYRDYAFFAFEHSVSLIYTTFGIAGNAVLIHAIRTLPFLKKGSMNTWLQCLAVNDICSCIAYLFTSCVIG